MATTTYVHLISPTGVSFEVLSALSSGLLAAGWTVDPTNYTLTTVGNTGAYVPAISGNVSLNTTLVCVLIQQNVPTYQWLRNLLPITGATAASYKVTSLDISQPLTCLVIDSGTSAGITIAS